jgi:hypothetical protein
LEKRGVAIKALPVKNVLLVWDGSAGPSPDVGLFETDFVVALLLPLRIFLRSEKIKTTAEKKN